ncbi:MAG: putative DCC family thiol-disulfide oxidoreductase YuxK [Glaciecola sp.]|jgi:predicted DCC family thiol-disulfide oxidoreductase YuxK
MAFTLFYDGLCPLCEKEMTHLIKRDKDKKIVFEDISLPDFSQRYPDLCLQELNARIHGQLDDGTMITGLDVTHKAWSLVGVTWLYAPLRWPVIRWFADKLYLVFAKHRYKISYWLTGKKRCESNRCNLE